MFKSETQIFSTHFRYVANTL